MPASKGIPIPAVVAERAFVNWEPSPSGCRISTLAPRADGYACIKWKTEEGVETGTSVHRAAWTHVHGQVKDGMTIDHRPTCNRRCVDVSHLRELTNFENARRTYGRDWPLGECVNGHSNDELYRESNGRLRCRSCTQKKIKRANDKRGTNPEYLQQQAQRARDRRKRKQHQ